jgi:hypothetical protein
MTVYYFLRKPVWEVEQKREVNRSLRRRLLKLVGKYKSVSRTGSQISRAVLACPCVQFRLSFRTIDLEKSALYDEFSAVRRFGMWDFAPCFASIPRGAFQDVTTRSTTRYQKPAQATRTAHEFARTDYSGMERAKRNAPF